MTLKTRMASDVSDVFLRTDDFATDEVTRYPRGDRSVGSAITCVVDLDNETGTGDAVIPPVETMYGEERVRYGRLEMAKSVSVHCDERKQDCDEFQIPGEGFWRALRVTGTDDDMQTVYIEQIVGISTRRTRPNR